MVEGLDKISQHTVFKFGIEKAKLLAIFSARIFAWCAAHNESVISFRERSRSLSVPAIKLALRSHAVSIKGLANVFHKPI